MLQFYCATTPVHSFVNVFIVLFQPLWNFFAAVFSACLVCHEFYEFQFVFKISIIHNRRNELKGKAGMDYSDGYNQSDRFNWPLRDFVHHCLDKIGDHFIGEEVSSLSESLHNKWRLVVLAEIYHRLNTFSSIFFTFSKQSPQLLEYIVEDVPLVDWNLLRFDRSFWILFLLRLHWILFLLRLH